MRKVTIFKRMHSSFLPLQNLLLFFSSMVRKKKFNDCILSVFLFQSLENLSYQKCKFIKPIKFQSVLSENQPNMNKFSFHIIVIHKLLEITTIDWKCQLLLTVHERFLDMQYCICV